MCLVEFGLVGGFADVFFGEEKDLTHGVGNFGRFNKGRHAVFGVVGKGDVVAKNVDFYRGIVFVGWEKSTI